MIGINSRCRWGAIRPFCVLIFSIVAFCGVLSAHSAETWDLKTAWNTYYGVVAGQEVGAQLGASSNAADDRQTERRKANMQTIRLEVRTWDIPDVDEQYLLSALESHERVLLDFSRRMAKHPSQAHPVSPQLRRQQMRNGARAIRALESELMPPFLNPYRQPIVGAIGYIPDNVLVAVAQVIDDDTFHGYFDYGETSGKFRLIFDGFDAADLADDMRIDLGGKLVAVDRPKQYASITGANITAAVIRPASTSPGLKDSIKRVNAYLKNPKSAAARERRQAENN